MSRAGYLIAFVCAGLVLAGVIWRTEAELAGPPDAAPLPQVASTYHSPGHDTAVLRGNPFTPPGPTHGLKSDTWADAPVVTDPALGPVDLAVALDQQVYPFLLPMIETFARRNDVKVAVTKGTCGLSAGLLERKRVHVGGFCCPPGRTDRLPGLRFHTLGIAAIALLANAANPLQQLDVDEARELFRGRIRHWAQLRGGRGMSGSVHLLGRMHCRTRPGHWKLLLASEDQFSIDMTEVGDIPQMLRVLKQDRQALGYETLWMVEREQADIQVKALAVDGQAPDDRSALARGAYPFYRVYNLTTWEDGAAGSPLAEQLVTYLMSQSHRLADKARLVPASELRKQGWQFLGDELIGEPLAGGGSS